MNKLEKMILNITDLNEFQPQITITPFINIPKYYNRNGYKNLIVKISYLLANQRI